MLSTKPFTRSEINLITDALGLLLSRDAAKLPMFNAVGFTARALKDANLLPHNYDGYQFIADARDAEIAAYDYIDEDLPEHLNTEATERFERLMAEGRERDKDFTGSTEDYGFDDDDEIELHRFEDEGGLVPVEDDEFLSDCDEVGSEGQGGAGDVIAPNSLPEERHSADPRRDAFDTHGGPHWFPGG